MVLIIEFFGFCNAKKLSGVLLGDYRARDVWFWFRENFRGENFAFLDVFSFYFLFLS